LVDLDTGRTQVVSTPQFGSETPGEGVLSHDVKTLFLHMSRTETDIWLARLGSR